MVDATLLIPPSRSFSGIVYLEQLGNEHTELKEPENIICTVMKYGETFCVKL